MRRRSRWAVLLVLLPAAGCGDDLPEPRDVTVDEAIEGTMAAGSARFVSSLGVGEEFPLAATEGVVEFDTGELESTFKSVTGEGKFEDAGEIVAVDGDFVQRNRRTAPYHEISGGYESVVAPVLVVEDGAELRTVEAALRALVEGRTFRVDGVEKVRGAGCTRLLSAPKDEDAFGADSRRVELWIDEDDRIRRVRTEEWGDGPSRELYRERDIQLTSLAELYDFGIDVAVELPAT